MKTKWIFFIICLIFACNGFAQDKLFEKLEDQKNITQVTVTKALLNMMPEITTSVDMNRINVKKIIAKLEQIDIFSTEEKSAKDMMVKEATEYFRNNKSYEVLMKIKDDNENVVFYGQREGETFKSLTMFIVEDNECTLIRLLGIFSLKDIQEITKEKK
jgi:hypothetical protein